MTDLNEKQRAKFQVGAEHKSTPSQEQDRSPGFLDRAMQSDGPPEPGVQVSRSDEGVLRTSIHGDGSVSHEHLKPMKGSTADRPLGTDAVANIRSLEGTPQTVNSMTEDSIVTLHGGGEVKLSDAIEAGLVVLTDDGSLVQGRDAPPVAKSVEKEPQEVHEDLKAVSLPNEADEQAMEALIADTAPSTQIEAIAEFAKDGEISARLISQGASEAGIEPSEMHDRLAGIQQSMFNQASDRVAKMGIDPASLWEHANIHMREALGKAAHAQLTKRTLHDYDNLSREYILTMDDHSPDAILNGQLGEGIKSVHRDDKGVIVLTDTNGASYSWKAAVRAGLVKLSRG